MFGFLLRFFIYLKRCCSTAPEMRDGYSFLLRLNRESMCCAMAQNDHDQNQADRQIEVLRAHAKQSGKTVTGRMQMISDARAPCADDAAARVRRVPWLEHDSCDDSWPCVAAGAEVMTFGGLTFFGAGSAAMPARRAQPKQTHAALIVARIDARMSPPPLRIHADLGAGARLRGGESHAQRRISTRRSR